jgi:hypothetical protein
MKNLVKLCVLTLVMGLFSPGINFTMAQENGYYMNFNYALSSFSVPKMSADFRTVPVHKDDSYYSSGTINRADYKFDDFFGFEFGWQWKFLNNTAAGFGIVMGGSSDNQGRNYTTRPGSEQRGYGAALTFSGISIQGPISLLGIEPAYPIALIPKGFFDIPLSDSGKGLTLSLSASYELLEAVNGWDRYDSYEVNDYKVLAHVIPLGISFRFKGIEIGGRYMLNFKTATGKNFGAEIYPFGLYLALDTRSSF